MIEFHSERAFHLDQKVGRFRSRAPRKAQPIPISDDLLEIILISFIDLDLTPLEMSKTSGLPIEIIRAGLAKRN